MVHVHLLSTPGIDVNINKVRWSIERCYVDIHFDWEEYEFHFAWGGKANTWPIKIPVCLLNSYYCTHSSRVVMHHYTLQPLEVILEHLLSTPGIDVNIQNMVSWSI